jgi:hypothetical protein
MMGYENTLVALKDEYYLFKSLTGLRSGQSVYGTADRG